MGEEGEPVDTPSFHSDEGFKKDEGAPFTIANGFAIRHQRRGTSERWPSNRNGWTLAEAAGDATPDGIPASGP